MSALKPFFVTLKFAAVVMAADAIDAALEAEIRAREIAGDSSAEVDEEVEISSLDHLNRLDAAWDGDCCAYGGGEPYLRDVLPQEDPPARDTKTVDMFDTNPA